jgi:hypothetical protein
MNETQIRVLKENNDLNYYMMWIHLCVDWKRIYRLKQEFIGCINFSGTSLMGAFLNHP